METNPNDDGFSFINGGGGGGSTSGGVVSGAGLGFVGSHCITKHVDNGSVESHRYYLSRKTVFEMLKDRGYMVPDSELTRSLTQFRSEFGNKPDLERLRITVSLRSNPSKKILVIFMGTDEIRVSVIRAVIAQILNKESLHGLILILQSKINSFARKELDKVPFKVEIFKITDLLVNITKHVAEPKLEILTPKEKQMLLKKYELEDKQFPQMLETDAITQYYGLEKGQLVKVTYSGEIVGSLETYRCIV